MLLNCPTKHQQISRQAAPAEKAENSFETQLRVMTPGMVDILHHGVGPGTPVAGFAIGLFLFNHLQGHYRSMRSCDILHCRNRTV